MTQSDFNQEVLEILAAIAALLGADKLSEPKHGIVGDPLADRIRKLEMFQPESYDGGD